MGWAIAVSIGTNSIARGTYGAGLLEYICQTWDLE